MREYAVLKNVVRGVNFGVVVKSAGSLKYYGWSDKGVEWSQWANENNASLEQLPVGVSVGEFKGMSDDVMKSIILNSADAVAAGEGLANTKTYSFSLESQRFANTSRFPSIVDKPLPIEPLAKKTAVNFKVKNFKQSVIQGEIAFKIRTHQLAFNNETNTFNGKPNRASQLAARNVIQSNMSSGTERKFGQRITSTINKQIVKNSGGLVIKRDIVGESTKEIIDVFTKARLGYAIGRSLGAAGRALTPNRGRSRTRGLAQRFISGDLDPRTRRDIDGDGMIFDGTWREMPDPSRNNGEVAQRTRRAARSGSEIAPASTPQDDGPMVRSRRLGLIDTRGSQLATRITYDMDNGDTVVYYRDGRVEEFPGVPYDTARRASVDGTADRMIRNLEKQYGRASSDDRSEIGNLNRRNRRSSSFSDVINELLENLESNENPEYSNALEKFKRGNKLSPDENKLVMSKLNDEKKKRRYSDDSRIDNLIEELKSRENIGKEKDNDRGARSGSGGKTWNLQERVRRSKTPMSRLREGATRKPRGTRGEERRNLRTGKDSRAAASRSVTEPSDSRISRAPMNRLREGKFRRPKGTRGEERSRLRRESRSAASRSKLPEGFTNLGFSSAAKRFAGVFQGDDFDSVMLDARRMDGASPDSERYGLSEAEQLVVGVASTLSSMDFNGTQTVPEQRKMIKQAIAETIKRMGLRMSVDQTRPLENYLAAINGGMDADAASALRGLETGDAAGLSTSIYSHRANALEVLAAHAFKKVDFENPESVKQYEKSRGFKAKFGPALDAAINRYLYSDLGRAQVLGAPQTDSNAAKQLNRARMKLLAAGPFGGEGADFTIDENLFLSDAVNELWRDAGDVDKNSPLYETMKELSDVILGGRLMGTSRSRRERRTAPGGVDTEQTDQQFASDREETVGRINQAIARVQKKLQNGDGKNRGARSSSNVPPDDLGSDIEDAITTVLRAKRGDKISKDEAINARNRLRLILAPDSKIDIDEDERAQLLDYIRGLNDVIDGGRGARSTSGGEGEQKYRNFMQQDLERIQRQLGNGEISLDEATLQREAVFRQFLADEKKRKQARGARSESERSRSIGEDEVNKRFAEQIGNLSTRRLNLATTIYNIRRLKWDGISPYPEEEMDKLQSMVDKLDRGERLTQREIRYLAQEAKKILWSEDLSDDDNIGLVRTIEEALSDYMRYGEYGDGGGGGRGSRSLSGPTELGSDVDDAIMILAKAKRGEPISEEEATLVAAQMELLMAPDAKSDIDEDERAVLLDLYKQFENIINKNRGGNLGASGRGARSQSSRWNTMPKDYQPTDSDIEDAITSIVKLKSGEQINEKEAANVLRVLDLMKSPDSLLPLDENQRIEIMDLIKAIQAEPRAARSVSTRRPIDDSVSTRMSRANVDRASSPRGARSASSAARTPVAQPLENRRLNFTELESRLGVEDGDGDGRYFGTLSDEEKGKVEGAVAKIKADLTSKLKDTFDGYWEAQARGAKKQSIRAARQRAKGTGGRYAPRPSDDPINAQDVEEMTLRLIDAVNDGSMEMFEKDKATGQLKVVDGQYVLKAEFVKVQQMLDNMLAIINMENSKDFSRLEHLHPTAKKAIATAVGKPDTKFTRDESSIAKRAGGYMKTLPTDLASDQELGKNVKLAVGKRILRTNPRREARALRRSRRLNRSGFRTGTVIDPKLEIAQRRLRFRALKRKMIARFTKTKDPDRLSADLADRKKELTPISVDNAGVVTVSPQYIDMLAILSGDKTAAKARKKLSQRDYDKLLYDLWENNGFSDSPILVPEDQVKILIAAGWQPIIRGTGNEDIKSETYVEQFLTDPGRFIPGQGMRAFGVGEYFRIAGSTAWGGFSGGPNDRHTIVGLLPPSADIVSVAEMKRELATMRNLTSAIISQEKIAGGREAITKMEPGEVAQLIRKGLPDLDKETSRSGQIIKQLVERIEQLDKEPDTTKKNEEMRKILAAINYLDDFVKQGVNNEKNVGYFAPIIGVDGIDTNDDDSSDPLAGPFLLHNRSILVAFLAPVTNAEAERITRREDGTIVGNVWRKWRTRPDRSREGSGGGTLIRRARGGRGRRNTGADGGGDSATPTPTPTPTPNSVTPKSAITVDNWAQSNPPSTGSNPATMLTDPMGTKYYTKLKKAGETPAEALERMETEVLAGKLYELAGAPVADLQMGVRNGEPVMLSRIIQSKMPSGRSDNDAARQNFVVDAWLANWDAPLNDNIKIDTNGRAVRLDVGGSLDYRAQGAKKGSGGTVPFGPKVGEMTSLQKRGNVDFTNMDRAEIKKQALGLSTITDDQIRQTVSAIVTDPARAKLLADTLIARRDDIVANWSK